MNYVSFLAALKTSGVCFMRTRYPAESTLAVAVDWRKAFVEAVSDPRPRICLYCPADDLLWAETSGRLKEILLEYLFDSDSIERILANVVRNPNVAQVVVRRIADHAPADTGEFDADLSRLSEVVSFSVSGDFFTVPRDSIAEAIDGIEPDASFVHFDPMSGQGSYVVRDGTTRIKVGDELTVAVYTDVPSGDDETSAALPWPDIPSEAYGLPPEQIAPIVKELPASFPDLLGADTALNPSVGAVGAEPDVLPAAESVARVQLGTDKDVILISGKSAIATFDWKPNFSLGVRRLSIEPEKSEGGKGYRIMAGTEYNRSGELLVSCNDEAEARDLLQQLDGAICKAMGVRPHASVEGDSEFIREYPASVSTGRGKMSEVQGWTLVLVALLVLSFALPVLFRLGISVSDHLLPPRAPVPIESLAALPRPSGSVALLPQAPPPPPWQSLQPVGKR
ncbi:hypothetical protein R70006_06232 [Paraburkholderia domus]|uniref:hypothetical protein n=1 Tax=Paraburkholderia domus TaxID=2793075 RepID=UPI00191457EF|nr:hypothetical protein [Paraburkholderia domus]MBK5052863.1 hypothetical protein [Burkholderia sp. R-70006]CAE6821708.1 hypothetical protein R70006_06232 [Paraburkholderia domus]